MSTANLKMRERDVEIFKGAAVFASSWILLRQTNIASLKFVGRADCLPKPLSCKFKTANRDSKSCATAGLVVSFELHPDAFEKPEKAQKEWMKYAAKYGLKQRQFPPHKPNKGYGLDLDERSDRFGCITLDGKYLYGDYDLFDIIRKGDESRNMGLMGDEDGENTVTGINYYQIRDYVNQRIGIDMIQHPGAALFDRSFEDVYVFSPTGAFEEWPAVKLREEYRKWRRRLINAFRQEPVVPPPIVSPAGPSLKLVK
jgi:hypothetical protein